MKRNFYSILLSMLVLGTSVFAQNKSLVYVTPDASEATNKDFQVISAIEAHGGYDVTLIEFGIIDEGFDLPTLNDADVVIMGRGIGSNDVLAAKDVWDMVTSPVLSMCMWGLRSNRALWFNSDACAHEFAAVDAVLPGNILVEDAVFDGMTGTIDWWIGPWDYINVMDAGNGTMLAATAEGYPLLARWEAGTEFYEGSGQIPQGPRSYIGLGIDDASAEGGINYFGFSEDAEKVFWNELAFLAGGTSSTNDITNVDAKISVIATTTNVTISMDNLSRVEIYALDGKKMVSQTSQTNTLELSSALQTGIYIVKAFDSNGSIATEKFIVR